MRQHLALTTTLVALATPVLADTGPAPIDIKPVAAKLEVWRDDTGKYYVVPNKSASWKDDATSYTFHGDGKAMYQQRVTTSKNDRAYSVAAWAPRVRGLTYGMLELRIDGTGSVICRQDLAGDLDSKPLKRATPADAKRVLSTARFLAPLWRRTVTFFGRDDTGKYYLVDMLRAEYGGGGHRLFVGKKGQLKRITITDTAEDTGGTAIMTKISALEIPPDGTSATLKTGRKSTTIQIVDAISNRYLIYRELGVYGQLGTICEDQ